MRKAIGSFLGVAFVADHFCIATFGLVCLVTLLWTRSRYGGKSSVVGGSGLSIEACRCGLCPLSMFRYCSHPL